MRALFSIKLILLSVLVTIPLIASVGCDSGAKDFNLQILRGALTLSPAVLRVEQHRDVLLNMSTDEAGTLRIPDIEVEAQLDPAAITPVEFNAVRIGSFTVTWQGEGEDAPIEVAKLDVFPAR